MFQRTSSEVSPVRPRDNLRAVARVNELLTWLH